MTEHVFREVSILGREFDVDLAARHVRKQRFLTICLGR